MRLLQSTSVLAVTLSATACGNPAAAPRPKTTSAACEVAANYAAIVIAEAKGRPVVFTTDDEPFSFPILGGD